MKAGLVLALAAAAAIALAGCGERPQVVTYKQGSYQGKPDKPPYDSAPFNGNRSDWENVIKTRQQKQNEYRRIGG